MIHPNTNEIITLLILGGISNDLTYLIQDEYTSNEIPKSNFFAAFRDSFGISYNDTSWVIYHLGDIEDQYEKDQMNFDFVRLDKVEYRYLIDSTDTEFVHRYYF
ncbi:MAG: hypothetical protein RIE52_10550 [Balneola sp.]